MIQAFYTFKKKI